MKHDSTTVIEILDQHIMITNYKILNLNIGFI